MPGPLKLDLAQFRELAAFAKLASDLDKNTQAQLTRGEKITEVLKQPQFHPQPVEEQVVGDLRGDPRLPRRRSRPSKIAGVGSVVRALGCARSTARSSSEDPHDVAAERRRCQKALVAAIEEFKKSF